MTERYFIIFEQFNRLTEGDPADIVGRLEAPAMAISMAVLDVLHPGCAFEPGTLSESDTRTGSGWPRCHSMSYCVVPAGAARDDHYTRKRADILISYSFDNPRDGDGWSMSLRFEEKRNNPAYLFTIEATSHMTTQALYLWRYRLDDEPMARIEKRLNLLFEDAAAFVRV